MVEAVGADGCDRFVSVFNKERLDGLTIGVQDGRTIGVQDFDGRTTGVQDLDGIDTGDLNPLERIIELGRINISFWYSAIFYYNSMSIFFVCSEKLNNEFYFYCDFVCRCNMGTSGH